MFSSPKLCNPLRNMIMKKVEPGAGASFPTWLVNCFLRCFLRTDHKAETVF